MEKLKRGFRALTPPKGSCGPSTPASESHIDKKRRQSWKTHFSRKPSSAALSAPSLPEGYSSVINSNTAPSKIQIQHCNFHGEDTASPSSRHQRISRLILPTQLALPARRDGSSNNGNDTLHIGEADQLRKDSVETFSRELDEEGGGYLDARGWKRVEDIRRTLTEFEREAQGEVISDSADDGLRVLSTDTQFLAPAGLVSVPTNSTRSRNRGSQKGITRGDEQIQCSWKGCDKLLNDRHRLKEHIRRKHILCWECRRCGYRKGDMTQIERHSKAKHEGESIKHQVVADNDLMWYQYHALSIRGVNIHKITNAQTADEVAALTGVKPPPLVTPTKQPVVQQSITGIDHSSRTESASSALTPPASASPDVALQDSAPPQRLIEALFSWANERNISADVASSRLHSYVESISSQTSTPMSAITPKSVSAYPTDSPSPQTTRPYRHSFQSNASQNSIFRKADSPQSTRYLSTGRNMSSSTSVISPAALARSHDVLQKTPITGWHNEDSNIEISLQGSYRESSIISNSTSAPSEQITTPTRYSEQSSMPATTISDAFTEDVSMMLDPAWLTLPGESYMNSTSGTGYLPGDDCYPTWDVDNMTLDPKG